MDSFQQRKHKNFQVESDPCFGHLWNQTLTGLTKPGRHFGLGASRHMKKHRSLQLNSRPIGPEFRSALFWTVFRSANTKIFRLNPILFLVTFEIKLWLGLLNQGRFKKDFLCSIEISSMMRCLMLWSSAINTGIMSEFMLWPFGRQCSTLHYPGLVTVL